MQSNFERMVNVARTYGPELVERLMEIVRGEDRVIDEVIVPTKDADRISAAKVIAGIILNKEAQAIKGEDALENLSVWERRRIVQEALEEINKEIEIEGH